MDATPPRIGFEAEGVRIDIDPQDLRERVSDPDALARWCRSHPQEPRTVAYLRMLGRLDEAERAGLTVLSAPGLHPIARAVARTRLAQVLQWQGRFPEADAEFSRAAEETGLTDDPTAPSSLLALAAVLQHRAKSRWEQACALDPGGPERIALREAAREDAQRALAMRIALGAPADQIASSKQTVDRLAGEDESA